MAIQSSNNNQPNGINPLAYLGVNATNPPELTVNSNNPLPSNAAFALGTLWVNPDNGYAFILTRFVSGAAQWSQLYPSTAVGTTTFHTPMGTATESGGAINIDGVGLVETFASGSTVNIALTEGLNGQIPIAATGFATEYATITAGSGISVTNGPNSITIASTVSGGITTIDGDTGSVTGTTVTIEANQASLNCGSTVSLSGSGSTLTLNVTDVNANVIIGNGSGNLTNTGQYNTGLGFGTFLTLTSGLNNVAIGGASFTAVTSGSNNTAVGEGSLSTISTGSNNIALGYNTGTDYTGSESSNILIGANILGTPAESNVLRIGDGTGSGDGQLQAAYISGINGVNVGSVATVVTNSGDQLGTAMITAGAGITITPGANTITISSSSSIVGYTPVDHSMSPYTVLESDYYISCLTSTGTITILLPNSPAVGEIFVVKDRDGNAPTDNITVTTVGGVVLIDGLTSYVMNTSYESSQFIFNGSAYEVF